MTRRSVIGGVCVNIVCRACHVEKCNMKPFGTAYKVYDNATQLTGGIRASACVLWCVDNNVQAVAWLTRMDACPTVYKKTRRLFLRTACVHARAPAVFFTPRPLRARRGGGQRRAARAAAAVPALTSRRCVPAVVGAARHRTRSTSTL